ncbi:MAG: ABC transporter ATP-binding protein/permease [Tepidibacter sp.]|uniref:ABC transporter ATP-binding protein n=1 Tax=Tepidibacter sp. TaxID=2529387 RepID=UPI0025E72865|nr:ABC transporter ATP-binding protein [Tepidibacter sp.]MCT4507717.1 ABC transporter ATP-binding protein/permease [Tepidibacter sp.]
MDNKKNIRRFLKIVFKKNKLVACLAFSIMLIVSILELLIPQLTRMILDDAIRYGKINLLIKLILIYVVVSISSALFDISLEYIYSKMKKSVGINLKIKLLKHLSKLSGNYYTNIKTGNILNIIQKDTYNVENFGADILFSLIVDTVTAVTALFFLIKMQFDLLILVIALQLLIIVSQAKFTKIIARKTGEVRNDAGNISNVVQEYVSNIMNIVISKSSFRFFKKYINKEKNLIKKCINLDLIISINMGIASILSSLITIFIYGYGGFEIIKGNMTIGELVAFQQYTNMLIGPSIRIIRSNTRIQQSAVSINRIFSILDEPITISQNNKGCRYIDDFNGNIKFNKVRFSYEEDAKAIDNINMEFEKGKTVALVGSSGCGKSTIGNLLFRLWDVDDGNITIDNIPLKNYNLKNIRNNISIVTQDLLLFDDTIFNNLTLGNKNINIKDVECVCKKVGIYEFICNLPNGFKTIVGEKGVKLSGGQKQRISIARSLLSNAKIIIFDEATSALDNLSQKDILENIKYYLKNKTTILIAHRLSTIQDADIIYVLDDGKIIEKGNHEELIQNQKYYYSFFNEQRLEHNIV